MPVVSDHLPSQKHSTDWDRLQYYSRNLKVKFFEAMFDNDYQRQVQSSTYFRIAQRQSSALFPSLRHLHYDLSDRSESTSYIFLFLSPHLDSLTLYNIRGAENTTIVGSFLTTLSSRSQMLSRIDLRSGQLSADTLKKSFVHFKHLRSLELSDAVFMRDFVMWEVLGTLPYLANFTLKASDHKSHPAHAPANSNSQSGGPKYFGALECLFVEGSFFLIQHLLGFIDSPYLNSIEVYPVINRVYNEHEHETEDLLTPSMTIVASKWSQSLKKLFISTNSRAPRNAISKWLMLLTDLHEMQTFLLDGWRMENMDDDVRRLVMSWPKLRSLRLLPLNKTFIPLSTLRIIAENCPDLRHLLIYLDTSTIPPFDDPSKSLHHKLEILTVADHNVRPSNTITQATMQRQIQVTRYLDQIFPYLKGVEIRLEDVFW